MSGEQKTAEQISLEIVGPLPVPGQRKWAAGLSKQDLIIKAMQVYADQQNAALKAALAELTTLLESLQNERSIDDTATHRRYIIIKAAIDRAKKLLNKQPQSESYGDKNL